MVSRKELERFLQEIYRYDDFQDYCHNGLQVEGKEQIRKIVFAVSFHLPLLEQAIAVQTDAIVVHHGIFGKDFFRLTGRMREKIRLLLSHEISLFGIHLPMDAHEQFGNNAQLLSYLDAEILEPFDVGFIARNRAEHSLSEMIEIFHQKLQVEGTHSPLTTAPASSFDSLLKPQQPHGFLCYPHGPERPQRLAVVSGGSSRLYRSEDFEKQGIDTFICGSVDEATPAVAYENRTNFLNIGHYWSEKAGPLALQTVIDERFDVETLFVDIENVV
ncbi:MAG: Nif3-like dinuclear metal center hexameric protein [bacterium]|nr:Nif3-like dinuclear metal center hexameric protein [bacterium]